MTAKFVLVSYDAYGDTPQRLARYRTIHELPPERWLILRGGEDAVAHLASRIGLAGYADLLDHFIHAYRIVVLNDDGVIVKSLDQEHNDVASLFEAGWP